MDHTLDKIDSVCSNEVVKQEWVSVAIYEINLKGDLNVI